MKRNHKLFFYLIIFIGYLHTAAGQNDIPIGQWRTHFNYRQSYDLAFLDDKIYSNTGNGLMEIDLANEVLSTLSKTNHLSDAGITALAASIEANALIIGYSNGNIDILKESTTYNINSLLRDNRTSSKRINDIFFTPTSFFTCTGFGLLEIDLNSLEIITTFEELGRNGKEIAVFNGAASADSVYLASEEGILSASLTAGLNLLDFRNWKRTLESEGTFDFIAIDEQAVYAAKKEGRLWINKGNGWEELIVDNPITFLVAQGGELLFGGGNQLFQRSADGTVNRLTLGVNTEIEDVLKVDGQIWIADRNNGLAQMENEALRYYSIAGPSEKNIFKIRATGRSVYTLGGGYERAGLLPYNRAASVSEFASTGWELNLASEQLQNASDIASTTPGNFILLYGDGIYDLAAGELIDHTTPGSLFISSNGFVPVTAISSKNDNELVISSNQPGIKYFLRNSEGAWQPLSFIPDSMPASISLVPNSFGDFYGILPGSGGLLVFNVERREYRILNAGSGLPSSSINDVAFDRDDYAWIATANGMAVIANTYEIFDPVNLLLTYPVAGNQFVLDEETVHAVEVDGANRKWIGTPDGLFLLDEYGEGTLTSFNRENSPLLTNEVLQIEINQQSGEVFVLTTAGLISYRSRATRAESSVQPLKIFPNPVRPGYGGVLAIEGLPYDAVVKITDEGGRLVREMVSFGGRATWNLQDYRGNRAAAGVYLVFASMRDGSEAMVGKFAIIE